MPQTERHVRLFRNGRNQAVRIPREFELEGDEAIMRKEGSRLIVEPVRKGRLLSLLVLPGLVQKARCCIRTYRLVFQHCARLSWLQSASQKVKCWNPL